MVNYSTFSHHSTILLINYVTETEPFVNLLFKTLETQDYITPVIPNANPPNPNIKSDLVPVKSTKTDAIKEVKPIIPVNELPNLNETVNGSTKKEAESKRDRDVRKSESVGFNNAFKNISSNFNVIVAVSYKIHCRNQFF